MAPREYICCSGTSCAGWIWADRAKKNQLCKMCSTPWANSIRKARQNWSKWKPQWPTVAEAAYWQPPKKPKTPKAPLPNKVLQALGVAWDSVPEEVQKNLKEAGYKPPKAQVKEEVDDLADLCQKHEAALPEEVKAYLKGLKASQEVTPSQAASQASQSWQSAAGKLKHIADQKIDLQKRIDMAKESLRQLLQEMIVLNEQAERAQKAVEASSGLLKERVFCETAADMEVDSILQELRLTTKSKRGNSMKLKRREKQRLGGDASRKCQCPARVWPGGLGTRRVGPGAPKQGPHRANVRPQARAGTHAANCPAVPNSVCRILQTRCSHQSTWEKIEGGLGEATYCKQQWL